LYEIDFAFRATGRICAFSLRAARARANISRYASLFLTHRPQQYLLPLTQLQGTIGRKLFSKQGRLGRQQIRYALATAIHDDPRGNENNSRGAREEIRCRDIRRRNNKMEYKGKREILPSQMEY